jgi:hypothetical protein
LSGCGLDGNELCDRVTGAANRTGWFPRETQAPTVGDKWWGANSVSDVWCDVSNGDADPALDDVVSGWGSAIDHPLIVNCDDYIGDLLPPDDGDGDNGGTDDGGGGGD